MSHFINPTIRDYIQIDSTRCIDALEWRTPDHDMTTDGHDGITDRLLMAPDCLCPCQCPCRCTCTCECQCPCKCECKCFTPCGDF